MRERQRNREAERQRERDIKQQEVLVDTLKHYNHIMLLFKDWPSFHLPYSFISKSNYICVLMIAIIY